MALRSCEPFTSCGPKVIESRKLGSCELVAIVVVSYDPEVIGSCELVVVGSCELVVVESYELVANVVVSCDPVVTKSHDTVECELVVVGSCEPGMIGSTVFVSCEPEVIGSCELVEPLVTVPCESECSMMTSSEELSVDMLMLSVVSIGDWLLASCCCWRWINL